MSHKNYVGFQTENGKRLFAALSNPKYNFRTVNGLAKESKLTSHEVEQILTAAVKDRVVVRTQNRFSEPIFCLREDS
jgi:hypothetical protein